MRRVRGETMKLWTLQYPSKIEVKGIKVNCETFEHFVFRFMLHRRLKKLLEEQTFMKYNIYRRKY